MAALLRLAWRELAGAPAAALKERVCRLARGAAHTARYAWLPAPRWR